MRSLRLQGSALPYTLMISLLISLLLGGIILLFSYRSMENDQLYFKELAYDNLASAINTVLYGEEEKFGEFAYGFDENGLDSAYIRSSSWGLYAAIYGKGVHGPAKVAETYLFGQEPEGYFSSTLFLRNSNRPLILSGKTKLKGILYVPSAGIRSGFVGRIGFQGGNLYQGERLVSNDKFVYADYNLATESRKLLKNTYYASYPQTGEHLSFGDTIDASFHAPTRFFYFSKPIVLSQVTVKGNCIIVAPQITISPEANLQHILLFAQSIRIEKGFRGSIQAFASDSIWAEKNVSLDYPSALLVSSPTNTGFLSIDDESTVEGMVINDTHFINATAQKGGYTLIDSTAKVYGNVYVPFNLDIKGTVFGNSITNNFHLRTPSSIYENYLLDATLSRDSLDSSYVMGFIGSESSRFQIIRKL